MTDTERLRRIIEYRIAHFAELGLVKYPAENSESSEVSFKIISYPPGFSPRCRDSIEPIL